jgi:PAS domain S-box-containing protein
MNVDVRETAPAELSTRASAIAVSDPEDCFEIGRRIATDIGRDGNALGLRGTDAGQFGTPFRLLFEKNPVPMYVYDWETLQILAVNDRALAQYGYTSEQFLALSMPDLVAPEELEQVLQNRSGDEGLLKVSKRRHRKADHSIVFVEIARDRLLFEGRPAALVSCIDVTEKTLADRERMAAEGREAAIHRRFAEAIEHIPSSLMLFDPDDRIVICNSATRKYFPTAGHLLVPGVAYEDLLRAHVTSGYVEGVGDNVEEWIQDRLKSHRAANSSITRAYRDGDWSQIIERRTSDGGIIAVRIDITALKHHEQELNRQAQEIAEHAREVERSNAELEQFAYVASHDLQEPLRMVASYCQLLQRRYKDKLDEAANEFIGFAVEGASRMQRLINDLLAYSRIGRKGGDPAPLEFSEAVKTALANLEGAIADSGAEIDVGPMPRVVGVPMQLAQLMQNLIGNAIKFRRAEVPPVISVSAIEEDGAWHIAVADNGIGIEPQYLERVFLIFQRLHERNKYPGTGIGLAIAKKVIECHGGRIWIESTPNRGSRFHFTLPSAA